MTKPTALAAKSGPYDFVEANMNDKLTLVRYDFSPSRTIGVMWGLNGFTCQTIEDMVRPLGEKLPGRTAIPAGTYTVDLTMSTRFQRLLPLVCDVPNFTGVRIHAGNTEADTEGCVLVGMARLQDSILRSREALAYLLQAMAGKPGARRWKIDIRNEPLMLSM